MPLKTGRGRIGTSGYQYPHWKERFYPATVPRKAWFDYYAGHFDTVEINNTFYNLPSPETFDRWRAVSPDEFRYALKFSRYGSHVKRLNNPDQTIARFLEAAGQLGDRLGPILVQLPPHWRARPERLEAFLQEAPRRYRWALEFRDPSWLNDDVYAILRAHGAALCIHDMIEQHPRELTAAWTYLRFHGDHYTGSYSTQFLTAEADRISALLHDGYDVYAYFNNDDNAYAAHNALSLKHLVHRRTSGR